MPDTAASRRRARCVDNLKKAEINLLEAKLEADSRDAGLVRGIENALGAVKWSIRRSATVKASPKPGPNTVVE